MSFIASLAAMGTSLAASGLGALGVSTAAGTIGAGVASGLGAVGAGALTGSALGAVTSAATGQDVGEGASMGAMTGAIGGGLSAGLGSLAPAANAGTEAATAAGTQTAAELGSDVAIKATENAIPATYQGLSNQAVATGGENLLGQSASTFAPSYSSVGGNAGNIVGSGIGGTSTAGAIGDFLPTASNIGGSNAAIGNSGISAINNRLMANQLGSEFVSQAPTAPAPVTTAEKIGVYAKENPGLVSTVGSLGSGLALNSMMAPDTAALPTTPEDPWSKKFKYNQQFNYNSPFKYAAGGITDLDGYASQAQNIAAGGITQIPNPAEVADPEGYGQESVRMMAGGGFTGRLMDSVGDNLIQNIPLAHAFGWDSASEIPLIGGLFSKPEALPATATLTPEEKQKLMAMMAAQQGQQQMAQQPQQMARGGIADLGDYAAGGRPNLLHGAGDGVSDDIPASIAGKQPARLAAGEYVVPSRIVSELGNGSTDAGAQRLDEMVQKIQAGRKKTMGSKKQFANDSKAYKHLPA